MNLQKQKLKKTPSPVSNSSGGFWDVFCIDALLSEFPLPLFVLVLLGGIGFFLLYWVGKKLWEQVPEWKAALAKPEILRNVLICVGLVLGLSLFALDCLPVHTLTLDSVRAALCIAGVGTALYFRRFVSGTTRS